MRKLKLQMDMTIDGFVGKENGEQDWLSGWDWDAGFRTCVNDLTDSSDTILMGRKMTDEFVNYWTKAAENPESPDNEFAKKMVDYPKVVFTKSLDESRWANATLANGDLVEEVMSRKNQAGKDILVYGGASFVTSLINENLIDEYNFFVHPSAIGKGLTIFGKTDDTKKMKLVKSQSFDSGVVLLKYEKLK